ncbi:MAG: DUF488 domain-containing protein [Bacteroidota bacterium]
MVKYDQIQVDNSGKNKNWKKIDSNSYIHSLKKEDQEIVLSVYKKFGNFSLSDLIRFTYLEYPFYAVNSEIVESILTEEESIKIYSEKKKLKQDIVTLFTIGYEGISLETYLKKLLVNDVKLLCDVRKNPISMKNGFSKNQLRNACEKLNINYFHIPNLGIKSSKRKELKSISDYKILFDDYEKTVLNQSANELEKLQSLIRKYSRIALTCFEATPCMCHRGRITDFLKKNKTWEIPIKHL